MYLVYGLLGFMIGVATCALAVLWNESTGDDK
jgi:hypothetical protein